MSLEVGGGAGKGEGGPIEASPAILLVGAVGKLADLGVEQRAVVEVAVEGADAAAEGSG